MRSAKTVASIALKIKNDNKQKELDDFKAKVQEVVDTYWADLYEIEKAIVSSAEAGKFRVTISPDKVGVIKQYPNELLFYMSSLGYKAVLHDTWKGVFLFVEW